MQQMVWADRGQVVNLDKLAEEGQVPVCVGASRLGTVQAGPYTMTVWMQLRGSSWVESKEGKFRLHTGQWIAFEKESRPMIQCGRDGLAIGLCLDSEALRALSQLADCGVYAGRGSVTRSEARVALQLWRKVVTGDGSALSMRPVLLHLASLQSDLGEVVQRCPGRSRLRKRQVFGRMQRARMYLEGNSHRVVRIGELAELTNFSSWYLSKTFQSLYEESPQSLSARLRLERAALLLRETDMMIGEVASSSGFDNCCSFARAFRARFGTSASRYRESLLTDSANVAGASRKVAAFS
ncbi:MAG: helix-turn-helix domain-containing protein [Stenotrophomonas sp.]